MDKPEEHVIQYHGIYIVAYYQYIIDSIRLNYEAQLGTVPSLRPEVGTRC